MAGGAEPRKTSNLGIVRHPDDSVASEWREGWILVAVSLIGYAISVTHTYTLGVFMPHIEADFGWSRAEVSSGMIFMSVLSAACAPLAGILIDRFGTRKVGLPGMACYCLALGLLSTVSPPLLMWWGLWCLIGLTSAFINPTLWGPAITRQFTRNRGIALAIVLSGSSVCSALSPAIASELTEHLGWRDAYLYISLAYAALILPLMLLFFKTNQKAVSVRMVLEGGRTDIGLAGLTAREAFLSYRYLAIAIPAFFMNIILMGLVVHLVPMMTSYGLPPLAAAKLMGALGLGSIVGRLGTGALLDRYPGHSLGAIVFLLPILPLAILLVGTPGIGTMFLVTVLIGFSFGAEIDVTVYLSSRYFGARAFGTILGTTIGIILLGVGIGSTVAGYIYDKTGTYDLFLKAMIPLAVIAALLTRSLGPYPDSSQSPQY